MSMDTQIFSDIFVNKREQRSSVKIAIASIEVAPLENVIGTICKHPPHEFAVNVASELLVVSLLLLILSWISDFLS